MDSKFLNSVEKNRAKIPHSGGGRDIPATLGPSVLHAVHCLGFSPTAFPSSWPSQYSLQPSPQGSDYY